MSRPLVLVLIFALAACSSPTASDAGGTEDQATAATPGAAPPEPEGVVVAGGSAPNAPGATPPEPAQDPAPRPQGIPADPDRPVGPVVTETPKGGLTLAEFQDSMVERVMRLDADGDGALSREEVAAGGDGARMIGMADSDRDGRVTPAEIRAGAGFMFRQMDQNRDGRVTEDERPQR
ncbi:hypothetical protein [Brevundimonas sp.]|jgi:hypothetical protein|uniref:EF-hand domain-containing protein n=1 Tax=Brevundimonas sp. TaxID=1871086 RepID=UPI002E0DB81A|nr:hypothetical protein [Brevundimonas sp.]